MLGPGSATLRFVLDRRGGALAERLDPGNDARDGVEDSEGFSAFLRMGGAPELLLCSLDD